MSLMALLCGLCETYLRVLCVSHELNAKTAESFAKIAERKNVSIVSGVKLPSQVPQLLRSGISKKV